MGLGNLLGRKQDPELQSYMEVMVALALADGEIEDSEIDDIITTVISQPRMRSLSGRALEQMFRTSLRDIEREGIDKRLRVIAQKLTPDQRVEAMGMAISVSASDGEIEPQEMTILKKMQSAFGVTDSQLDGIVQRYR